MKRIILMSMFFAALATSVAGCANTIRGAGKDIKDSAHAVKEAVD